MKKFITKLLLIAAMATLRMAAAEEVKASVPPSTDAAPAAPAAKSDPDLAQRVADLEAYMNNSARVTTGPDPKVKSNIAGPGPGHNAWQMTSTALVLFMTLPGLALFY